MPAIRTQNTVKEDEGVAVSEKIPKPIGPRQRVDLQRVLGLSSTQYVRYRDYIKDLTRKRLNTAVPWGRQVPQKKSDILREINSKFPFFARFEDNWAARCLVQRRLYAEVRARQRTVDPLVSVKREPDQERSVSKPSESATEAISISLEHSTGDTGVSESLVSEGAEDLPDTSGPNEDLVLEVPWLFPASGGRRGGVIDGGMMTYYKSADSETSSWAISEDQYERSRIRSRGMEFLMSSYELDAIQRVSSLTKLLIGELQTGFRIYYGALWATRLQYNGITSLLHAGITHAVLWLTSPLHGMCHPAGERPNTVEFGRTGVVVEQHSGVKLPNGRFGGDMLHDLWHGKPFRAVSTADLGL
ncbi:hypothetical protein PLICRDRAFT_26780 [Plicaturopsis crispa FD-325 SS-3]|nr:hypothetical protein PLICRDRAFT_26780 [Plicaturopsis crispa FD-325 SS-3]